MKTLFFFFVIFMGFTIVCKSWASELIAATPTIVDDTSMTLAGEPTKAEGEVPQSAITLMGSVVPRDGEHQVDPLDYPLFRLHPMAYYPPKIARTAMVLSATLPGLGQAYAGHPGKGLAFLIAEIGLVAATAFNVDRATHYDDLANRFTTGFYDPHSNAFLTADQGHVKSRSHVQLGALFLVGGIGIYIWNIFDAAKTVDHHNERRFPVRAQQTVYGNTYLTISHRF